MAPCEVAGPERLSDVDVGRVAVDGRGNAVGVLPHARAVDAERQGGRRVEDARDVDPLAGDDRAGDLLGGRPVATPEPVRLAALVWVPSRCSKGPRANIPSASSPRLADECTQKWVSQLPRLWGVQDAQTGFVRNVNRHLAGSRRRNDLTIRADA